MPMSLSKSDCQALLRQDLYAFIERFFCELNPTTTFKSNWHLEKLSSALEACRRKEETRLIINQPPRSLKSHCTSVAFVGSMSFQDGIAGGQNSVRALGHQVPIVSLASESHRSCLTLDRFHQLLESAHHEAPCFRKNAVRMSPAVLSL